MDRIRLEIVGLSSGQTQGSYTLILGEESGDRKLPIVIGSFEAQAIAIEIEKIVPFRPMTHDLFVSFCKTFNIEITEVEVHTLSEGVFYSRMVCKQQGKTYDIDARTSDAIALAVRFHCPIYTTTEIMRVAGIVISEDEDEEKEVGKPAQAHKPDKQGGKGKDDYAILSTSELEILLDKALKVEDYARAAAIRDEINRRK